MGAGQYGCENLDWPYLNNVCGLNCRRAFCRIGAASSVNVDLVDNPVVVDMKLSPDGQHMDYSHPLMVVMYLLSSKRLRGPRLIFLNLSLIGRSAIFIGQITSAC